MTATPLRQRSAWQALETHKASLDATNSALVVRPRREAR